MFTSRRLVHPTVFAEMRRPRWLFSLMAAGGVCLAMMLAVGRLVTAQSCPNPIVCENQLPGTPSSEWDISGAGDASIQGFATDISVNKGGTVHFKVDTTAASFQIEVYRLGYYAGLGARKVATLGPFTGIDQGSCATDSKTGLIDCGTWIENASWAVPSTAVSGIYLGRLIRTDTGGASHIVFIVRDDQAQADVLFQTSDTTWQAYNSYGGNSLYTGGPGTNPARAYKVSYNRPFTTRGTSPEDWLFNAEYPMVRFLEANGYNMSYISGVDTDRYGATELLRHRIFVSTGHDEYWSGPQRANVEAARGAGVNLAFFSGNEMFWKTRWEKSIDGTQTPYRTLVSYKETAANAVIDPMDPPTWTGTWRDPRFSPPADGGRPENAVTGTLFTVNCCSTTAAIQVPSTYASQPIWRNTRVAQLTSGQTATLTTGTLGYEWDENVNNGYRPAGLTALSSTTVSIAQKLQDYGSTYGAGTATHQLTLYRHTSGALVFGAGTVQWSWGLDGHHDRASYSPDPAMQQAMINLFADMTVQPGSLQPGLVPGAATGDTLAPTSTITAPSAGSSSSAGTAITIAGTASDTGGGSVNQVQVSTDGGATWQVATGTTSWSMTWIPTATGTFTIKSRATDTSGNLETPSAGRSVTITGATPGVCPCTIWSAAAVPAAIETTDTSAVELGVKFKADSNGTITGIRFYKGATNTGTHIGTLWTSTGTVLASATFANESASGWQQVTFGTPVAVTANTVYVASYHTNVGQYGIDNAYFTSAGVDNAPLHALSTTAGGGNGVYAYSSATTFPNQTYNAGNYWVDVVFASAATADTTPPTVSSQSPAAGATGVAVTTTVTATFSEPLTAATVNGSTFTLTGPAGPVSASVTYNGSTATLAPGAALAASSTYTARLVGGSGGLTDLAGNALVSDVTWSFTTAAPSSCPCTIWPASAVPTGMANDPSGVELGVKFKADANGTISAIRFYKYAQNTGTHVGNLWSSTGTLLGTATFTSETASGWQQATFTTPVTVTANTTYIASYFTPTGYYGETTSGFATAVDNAPLHAIADSVAGGNGVYAYATASTYPSQTWSATNYWVDVVFSPTGSVSDTTPPTVSITTPIAGTTVSGTAVALMASASDNVGVAGVQFKVDGVNLGAEVTVAPYSVTWNTTTAANGAHTLTAVARDAAGNLTTSAPIGVTVSNASAGGLSIDVAASGDKGSRSTTIATTAFSTTAANELLLALVSADDTATGQQVNSVAGGGLTWTLVVRTNAQRGTAEIWRAFATTTLSSVTVTATLKQSASSSITVLAFKGADPTGSGGSGAVGATKSTSASSGAPTATLTTTRNNSWVIGVGNDWDNPAARTIGAGQTLVHQYLATSVGDTFWVQRQTSPTPASGTVVTINDTAPTADRYNLSLCEVLPQ